MTDKRVQQLAEQLYRAGDSHAKEVRWDMVPESFRKRWYRVAEAAIKAMAEESSTDPGNELVRLRLLADAQRGIIESLRKDHEEQLSKLHHQLDSEKRASQLLWERLTVRGTQLFTMAGKLGAIRKTAKELDGCDDFNKVGELLDLILMGTEQDD